MYVYLQKPLPPNIKLFRAKPNVCQCHMSIISNGSSHYLTIQSYIPKWFKVIDTWHKFRNEINRAEFDALLVIHPTADPNRHYQIHLLRACCRNWNYLWQNAIPLKKRSSMSLASSHVLSCTILSTSTLRR